MASQSIIALLFLRLSLYRCCFSFRGKSFGSLSISTCFSFSNFCLVDHRSPYGCPFADHCWSWIPEHSIFNIPGLRWSTKQKLLKEKQVEIDKLPKDFPLNEKQQRYRDSLKKSKAIIDWDAIKDELSKLEYPLYFLDFETDNPAIPRFDGMHPYEQFPFQYSCHIIDKSGKVTHKEFLHVSEKDPGKALAKSLTKAIGKKGTLICEASIFQMEHCMLLPYLFCQLPL
jgi:hypothetical protein